MLLRLQRARPDKFDVKSQIGIPKLFGDAFVQIAKNYVLFYVHFFAHSRRFHIKSLEKLLEICYNIFRGMVRTVGELRFVPKIQHNMEDIV